MFSRIITVLIVGLSAGSALAQSDEAQAPSNSGFTDTNTIVRGISLGPGDVFAGTALNGPGTNNDAVAIDPDTDTSVSVLTGEPIWGATLDPANARILYTTEAGSDSLVDGAPLYEMPLATGTPSLLGVINDGAGADFRIDGLAISGGVLYGTRAAASADGLYQIDLNTFTATLDFAYTDSISGIDADPATGTIYGANDTSGQLVVIDPAADTITNVAAYPDVNEGDLDGLAVGNGFAYLIPDDNDPGLIYVYDFASGTFQTPLTAPWGATPDTFSGGAVIASAAPPPESIPVPVNGPAALAALTILVLLLAAFTVAVRRHG